MHTAAYRTLAGNSAPHDQVAEVDQESCFVQATQISKSPHQFTKKIKARR